MSWRIAMVISVSRSIQKQAVPCLFSKHKFLFNTSPKERINRVILQLHHKDSWKFWGRCRWLSQKSRGICHRLFNLLKLQYSLEKVKLPLKSEKLSNYETYFAINVIAFSHISWIFCRRKNQVSFCRRRKNHVHFFMYMVNLMKSVNYMIALI